MLISVEKKFIFVANSKAASTSIESALSPFALPIAQKTPEKKHQFLEQIIAGHPQAMATQPKGAQDFFKFGVMRDPIDWIKSWFRYRKGNKVDAPLPADLTFSDFWAMNDWTKWRAGKHKRLQCDFFLSWDGSRLLADYIIPYTAIEVHFPVICQRLGIQATLERMNVSNINSDVPLDPELETEIRAFYAEDYAFLAKINQINAAAFPPASGQ